MSISFFIIRNHTHFLHFCQGFFRLFGVLHKAARESSEKIWWIWKGKNGDFCYDGLLFH